MPCNNKVEHPPKNIRVTYCVLQSGHIGICVDGFHDGFQGGHMSEVGLGNPAPLSCQVKSASGTQCGLPARHTGLHQNTSLGYGSNKW